MPSAPNLKEGFEILIAEDEEETLELLAEFCRSQGLGVTTAHDGRAAIAAIERGPDRFGAVVTDLHMPGADGFQVLEAAQAGNPLCPVVMVTGYATLDSALRAVRAGAYDYLPKPFALGQLEVILTRIRERRRLEQQNQVLVRQMADLTAAPAIATDLAWRLSAIEERLARIEDLLQNPPR
jgi:DNA-binding NtrC family response regulator